MFFSILLLLLLVKSITILPVIKPNYYFFLLILFLQKQKLTHFVYLLLMSKVLNCNKVPDAAKQKLLLNFVFLFVLAVFLF